LPPRSRWREKPSEAQLATQALDASATNDDRRTFLKRIALASGILFGTGVAARMGVSHFFDPFSDRVNSGIRDPTYGPVGGASAQASGGAYQLAQLTEDPTNPAPGEAWYNVPRGALRYYDGLRQRIWDMTVHPEVTLGTVGRWNGTSDLPNGGADFGGDTELAGELTQSGGANECFATLPPNNVGPIIGAYGVKIYPGQVLSTVQVVIPTRNLVLRGSGKYSSSIHVNAPYLVTSGQPAVFWSNRFAGSGGWTAPVSSGFYMGHMAWDFSQLAYASMLQVGDPGGTFPDAAAPSLLIEWLRLMGNSNPLAGPGLILDGLEDGLLFQSSTGGSILSWIVNDGSAKCIGGNVGIMIIASKDFAVYCTSVGDYIVIGNPSGQWKVGSFGIGFNGNPVIGYGNVNVQPGSKAGHLIADALNWSLDKPLANTGFITGVGGTDPALVRLICSGGLFSYSGGAAPQPLFAGGAAGYARIVGPTVYDQSLGQFLGYEGATSGVYDAPFGCYAEGDLVSESGQLWKVRSGFPRPVGLWSAATSGYGPWGTFTPYGKSAINAVGPGVAGAASPTASKVYFAVNGDVYITATGGSGVAVQVYDQNGNALLSSSPSTLQGYLLREGLGIGFGAFTGSLTTTVMAD
jgi:hypothetical protein